MMIIGPILWKERIYNRLTQEYVFEDMKLNVISLLNKAHGDLNKRTYDEIVHLGEDFMAKIVADRLGYTFVDTMNCVYLDDDGHITTMSYEAIASAVDGKNIVMSGFSGNCGGKVKLLPSGGSDIMGVTVADVTKSRFKRITETGIRVHDPKYGVANFCKIATFAEVGQMATLDEHVIHPAALHLQKIMSFIYKFAHLKILLMAYELSLSVLVHKGQMLLQFLVRKSWFY